MRSIFVDAKKTRVGSAGRARSRVPSNAVSKRRTGSSSRPRLSPGERVTARVVRDLVAQVVRDVTFVRAAIETRIAVKSDGFHVYLDVAHRETGKKITLDLCWGLPPLLASRAHAVDWIYACVRDAWVHELNEALLVGGVLRHDLHDDLGRTIPPPDEGGVARSEMDTFKVQLAAFLMGAAR